MTLATLIVYLTDDETLHVSKREKSLWIGKAKYALDDISDHVLCSKIKNIYTGFSGLCVEIW